MSYTEEDRKRRAGDVPHLLRQVQAQAAVIRESLRGAMCHLDPQHHQVAVELLAIVEAHADQVLGAAGDAAGYIEGEQRRGAW